MSENKLMTPAEMLELAKQGEANFKELVLNGNTFKNIIKEIEMSAIDGYYGWSKKLTSEDDIRELNVIQEHLIELGYQCEFKKEKSRTLLGEFTVTRFRIQWGEK